MNLDLSCRNPTTDHNSHIGWVHNIFYINNANPNQAEFKFQFQGDAELPDDFIYNSPHSRSLNRRGSAIRPTDERHLPFIQLRGPQKGTNLYIPSI